MQVAKNCAAVILMPKRVKGVVSKGKLNKFIDDVLHPFFKVDPAFILLDGFLHGLVERNPSESTRKFLVYNLPKLIKQLEKRYAKS